MTDPSHVRGGRRATPQRRRLSWGDGAGSAVLRDSGPQIDLLAHLAGWVQQVADLYAGQLCDPDASRVGQPEQHHITDGLAAGDRGNPDHMTELSRAQGGGMAGGWRLVWGGSAWGLSLFSADLRR